MLAAEVFRVAEAGRVRFGTPRDGDTVRCSMAEMAALNRRSHTSRSGIWRDLAVRSRRTGMDAQLGAVVELSITHGAAAPLVARMVAIVHALEIQKKLMAPSRLDELRRSGADT